MIIAVIPAKGHSKRLPNKNMQIINGVPLIEYTINYVKKSKIINDFYVTTDSLEIQSYCEKKKIKFIIRPESLGGETPIIKVYKHFLSQAHLSKKIKILLGVQIDHPDRKVSLDQSLQIFLKEKADKLSSIAKNGDKNGAHYILSKYFLETNQSRKDAIIIDDCINIHYKKDLLQAEKILKSHEKNN